MDVMNVSSSQHLTAVEACRGPHSRLLIEPLPVPDAKHTGLRVRQRKANSFFYANGGKSRALRGKVSDSLRPSGSVAQPKHNRYTDAAYTGAPVPSQRGAAERLPVAPFRTVEGAAPRVSGLRPADRKIDEHTKVVLANLRQNSTHLEKLLGLANT